MCSVVRCSAAGKADPGVARACPLRRGELDDFFERHYARHPTARALIPGEREKIISLWSHAPSV
jgi:hypothetical protein